MLIKNLANPKNPYTSLVKLDRVCSAVCFLLFGVCLCALNTVSCMFHAFCIDFNKKSVTKALMLGMILGLTGLGGLELSMPKKVNTTEPN